MLSLATARVGVVGLGYVGLPLAVEFGKAMPTVGYDINTGRINELKSGSDSTLELSDDELSQAVHLSYSDRLDDLRACNVFVVTVPTPIDRHKRPDLRPLESASRTVGAVRVPTSRDWSSKEMVSWPGRSTTRSLPVTRRKVPLAVSSHATS